MHQFYGISLPEKSQPVSFGWVGGISTKKFQVRSLRSIIPLAKNLAPQCLLDVVVELVALDQRLELTLLTRVFYSFWNILRARFKYVRFLLLLARSVHDFEVEF